jgi:hypothetical protein
MSLEQQQIPVNQEMDPGNEREEKVRKISDFWTDRAADYNQKYYLSVNLGLFDPVESELFVKLFASRLLKIDIDTKRISQARKTSSSSRSRFISIERISHYDSSDNEEALSYLESSNVDFVKQHYQQNTQISEVIRESASEVIAAGILQLKPYEPLEYKPDSTKMIPIIDRARTRLDNERDNEMRRNNPNHSDNF